MRVAELFRSLQGEGSRSGLPCTFVRLAGCPLRCRWCDTAFALAGASGSSISIPDIVQQVADLGRDFVLVTGGEPLLQEDTPLLLQSLLEAGTGTLALETSGAFPLDGVPDAVIRIVDMKCPGSGEQGQNRLDLLDQLRPADELKFVLASREDYEWARDLLAKHPALGTQTILFSPVTAIAHHAPAGPHQPTLPAKDLARWILEDKLAVRLQLQLHRLLWPGQSRGV